MSDSIGLADIIWQEKIWLPPNSTWSDVDHPDRAQFKHLAYPIPLAFLMMVLRFFLDRLLYRWKHLTTDNWHY